MLEPLYLQQSDIHTWYPLTDIKSFTTKKGDRMETILPPKVVDHVRLYLNHVYLADQGDSP